MAHISTFNLLLINMNNGKEEYVDMFNTYVRNKKVKRCKKNRLRVFRSENLVKHLYFVAPQTGEVYELNLLTRRARFIFKFAGREHNGWTFDYRNILASFDKEKLLLMSSAIVKNKCKYLLMNSRNKKILRQFSTKIDTVYLQYINNISREPHKFTLDTHNGLIIYNQNGFRRVFELKSGQILESEQLTDLLPKFSPIISKSGINTKSMDLSIPFLYRVAVFQKECPESSEK